MQITSCVVRSLIAFFCSLKCIFYWSKLSDPQQHTTAYRCYVGVWEKSHGVLSGRYDNRTNMHRNQPWCPCCPRASVTWRPPPVWFAYAYCHNSPRAVEWVSVFGWEAGAPVRCRWRTWSRLRLDIVQRAGSQLFARLPGPFAVRFYCGEMFATQVSWKLIFFNVTRPHSPCTWCSGWLGMLREGGGFLFCFSCCSQSAVTAFSLTVAMERLNWAYDLWRLAVALVVQPRNRRIGRYVQLCNFTVH